MRVRPLFEQEAGRPGAAVAISEDLGSAQVVVPGPCGATMQRDFHFHACLGPGTSQEEVMQLCGIQQLLDAALAGCVGRGARGGGARLPLQPPAAASECCMHGRGWSAAPKHPIPPRPAPVPREYSGTRRYNVTIFAYGQTGSGKTYTMSGREEVVGADGYEGDATHDGIVSRAVHYLFSSIAQQR
jgi:hypothetical protein